VSARRPLLGYLTAEAISLTGTRVSMIAIPWFVLTETGSATRTGLTAFAEMLPLVVLQAVSGPLIDRLGARRVAISCDLASVAAVGTIPLLHVAGLLTFPALLGLVAVAGALRGPGEAAKHALIPTVVEVAGTPMERATGLAGAVERTASMAGAAVAGGVVAAIGGANALVLDAASFLLSALVLGASVPRPISRTEPVEPVEPVAPVAPQTARGYVHELHEGWQVMRRDAILMGIGVMVAITNLLDQAYTAVLLPVWARDGGHGVGAVGLIGAVWGGSAIVGSVVAASYAGRLPRFKVYLVGFLLAGLPRYAAMGLGAPLGVVAAVAVVGGLGSGFLNPILGAVLFERTPRSMLGRVSAMNIAMSWALIPFGGLLGGAAVAGLGLSPALFAVGVAYFLTTLLPAVQPRWRELDDRPAPQETREISSIAS
jgi:MFS family permease